MNLTNYQNSDGFVTIDPNAPANPGEGNGFLQTGLAIAANCLNFSPQYAQVMLYDCQRSHECPLIYRSPHKKNADDNEAVDDYWGAFVLAYSTGNRIWPRKVLEFAEAFKWDFDLQGNRNPKYRFDRYSAFAPLLRLCAGQKLTIWEELILAGTIAWSIFKTDAADGNMKTFCQIYIAQRESGICKAVSRLWFRKIKKQYGTIGKSWAAYFVNGHPLVEYDA